MKTSSLLWSRPFFSVAVSQSCCTNYLPKAYLQMYLSYRTVVLLPRYHARMTRTPKPPKTQSARSPCYMLHPFADRDMEKLQKIQTELMLILIHTATRNELRTQAHTNCSCSFLQWKTSSQGCLLFCTTLIARQFLPEKYWSATKGKKSCGQGSWSDPK